MDLYLGLIVPTSNKQTGEFVFEPIIGRGKHAGLMFGGEFGKDIWIDDSLRKYVMWEVSLHGEYLFTNHQVRSFDLMHKPWSRYIELYETVDQAEYAFSLESRDIQRAHNIATPGINILTQPVYVTPGFSGDMNCAFVYASQGFHGECGYNLFIKQAECVKLRCPWQSSSAIKYADGLGKTNPVRTITGSKYFEQKINNENNTPLVPVSLDNFESSIIHQEDLDLQSATTPALLAHTLYGALGYRFEDREHPLIVNGGMSYTFSQDNAVISKWMIWVKGGVSF
jgi:hypothetical protein